MTPQDFITRVQSIVPRGSQVYLDVNILDESTLATLRDGVDVKIDTVANVAGHIWIFGYPDNNSDAQQAYEPKVFKEGLDDVFDSIMYILERPNEDGIDLFVVTETVKDYNTEYQLEKGACTNCYGVAECLERARKILRDSIGERFDVENRFDDEEDPLKAAEDFVEGNFKNEEKTSWHYFDGNTDYTFEIHKEKLS